ncbi:MAG: hypothetical protein A2516_01035 [Alphaproteobacteria bacterium RIFOXYD12_FULL_60_8]|nr:MAG: hypothetical protein A2516_01035 [Alphaproteobacteria bacterium RIFOXYD12_FULL_60_8]
MIRPALFLTLFFALILTAPPALAADLACGPGYGAPVAITPQEPITPLPPYGERLCLSYRVAFPAGFDFGPGGKLPVAFGGEAPEGCGDGQPEGFTLGLVWKRGGAGQVRLHDMDEGGRCGQSIGQGKWTFLAGVPIRVGQEFVLNTPDAGDGEYRLWIDGRKVVERFALHFRRTPATRLDGIKFPPLPPGVTISDIALWTKIASP